MCCRGSVCFVFFFVLDALLRFAKLLKKWTEQRTKRKDTERKVELSCLKKLPTVRVGHIFYQNAPTKNRAVLCFLSMYWFVKIAKVEEEWHKTSNSKYRSVHSVFKTKQYNCPTHLFFSCPSFCHLISHGGATKINSSFEDILVHGKSTWIAPKIMVLRFSMTSPKNEASRIVRHYAQDVFLLQKYSHVFE